MNSPLKWHGGKGHLADRIVAMMPPHRHYVEPFAGGLSVLFAKDPRGVSEVVNDINSHVANFWQVIRHDHTFEAFRRVTEATPFGEEDWRTAASLMNSMGWHECNPDEPPPEHSTANHVARASWFFIACRQSLAGRMDSFAPITRTRTRRGMNEQAAGWLSAVEGLPAVHERLRRVVVLNRDARRVIEQLDGPDTLFYVDPPYMPETRTSPKVYKHELTMDDHDELLFTLGNIEGKFLLSGYPSDLYKQKAEDYGWHVTEIKVANSAAGGKTKRKMTECVWTNYKPASGAASGLF